jgi:hypothetical protein
MSAPKVDVRVARDAEEPRTKASAVAKVATTAQGSNERLLDDLVGLVRGRCERARKPRQLAQ